jgi:uncharacterized membrane protein YfcA
VLPVYGFVVGLLVGLTGLGGGILMTPLLMLGVGMPAAAAVGTDLAYATLTKLAGTWQHCRQGTVDARIVWRLAAGSVPATLVAVGLLVWLQEQHADRADVWLERAIGAALLLAAFLMIRRLISARRSVDEALAGPVVVPGWGKLAAVGAVGGFMVGLTSIGSGSLIMALLVLVCTLRPERLVGTDIAHATLLVGAAALAHLAVGDVDLAVAGALVVGSVPGVLIGSRLVVRVPKRPLQFGLAGLLLTTGAQLLR